MIKSLFLNIIREYINGIIKIISNDCLSSQWWKLNKKDDFPTNIYGVIAIKNNRIDTSILFKDIPSLNFLKIRIETGKINEKNLL